jgi:hypothetical protein
MRASNSAQTFCEIRANGNRAAFTPSRLDQGRPTPHRLRMDDAANPFVTLSFLRSVWATEYDAFKDTEAEQRLAERLRNWVARKDLKETSAEAALIQTFFQDTWGYHHTGTTASANEFTLWPKFPVSGAGAKGSPGEADLALGFFGDATAVPQVLCEFKGIKSALDAEQPRKGNRRSPVRQCLDYLSHSRRGMIGSEPILPTWGLVTDMNEFRLYWYDRGHQQYLRFVIQPRDLFQGAGLLVDTEAARFDRFVFCKIFHRDTLLSHAGPSLLVQLIQQRRFRDREIEEQFYGEYRAFRDHLYAQILAHNGPGTLRFPGTHGRLVRLTQKILDRLLFVFFCEDMGQALAFPPKLFQDFLVNRANDPYFNPDGQTLWHEMLALFRAMNDGAAFGGKAIHQFNGGLFAPDSVLEALHVPNGIFCQHLQGQDEDSIAAHKLTVLYLCATYNYASDLGEVGTKGERKSLGLYTLGRIFEQSITELEMLEAEADGRTSLNRVSKRKTDGVYYTPEWVVERIVDGTIRPSLDRIRASCGWPMDGEQLPSVAAIDCYLDRLRTFTVLDPACGSGAFLITAMRYLADEWRAVLATRDQLVGQSERGKAAEAELIRDLLSRNIYGVDINPASVEIARLALWLHTARADRPLSSLEHTVRCGNSLVTSMFYKHVQLALDDAAQERVNAFDWREAFPEVAARGGFDAVVGNPPYVKLQNLRAADPAVADYLRDGRPNLGKPYKSTATGNFDLYLPFIEQGLALLNPEGRLGYIAPSLWISNEYGQALRNLIDKGRHLDRWLDFGSHQVFDEATIYTALQFFTKAPGDVIRVAHAPRGQVPLDPWSDSNAVLKWGSQDYGERWLLLTGAERSLIDRLTKTCRRLGDRSVTAGIFVGIQTSADAIYHLRRLGPGLYEAHPPGNPRPEPHEVQIEDEVMRPLVSGAEAKRYIEPVTETWLLFPYRAADDGMRLIPPEEFPLRYPRAWSYLLSHKSTLEMREAVVANDGSITGPVYDNDWYRYVYAKNLDKQHLPKLVVPRLVASLGCTVDDEGRYYLDNVDVGGVMSANFDGLWFLAGVLNSPVADFVFRRISKPFRGDYFSANRQFIAPLPIPDATPTDREEVAAAARELQRLHSTRRDLIGRLSRRLTGATRLRRPETWLFHGLPTPASLQSEAPTKMDAAERRAWARKEAADRLEQRYSAIRLRLRPGSSLAANLSDGELSFLIDGIPVIDRVFVTPAEAGAILAQWRVVAATYDITEKTTPKQLCDALRALLAPGNDALANQISILAADLFRCDEEVAATEEALNELIFRLYDLTSEERRLVA